MNGARTHTLLPRPAPHRVLALGAYLKNSACAIDGAAVQWSATHGDLGDPTACLALAASAERLIAASPGGPAAVAHDLHPDFHSTRLAQGLAARLGVPAIPVQHHHAHLAVVAAEHGLVDEPLVGWALDGFGLGTDGTAWGGELLWLDAPARSTDWRRLAHLPALALPGGDRAAREPWRMAAALLHALNRGEEIVARLGPVAGTAAAATVRQMLQSGLNCPRTTAAGRWFDAAAAAIGAHRGAQREAEAAVAIESEAARWLAAHPAPPVEPLALHALAAAVGALFGTPPEGRGAAAARFHALLADTLASAAIAAAQRLGVRVVALGGGCFANGLLAQRIEAALRGAGLRVLSPGGAGCGDAGLALGQAWIAAWTVGHGTARAGVPAAAAEA